MKFQKLERICAAGTDYLTNNKYKDTRKNIKYYSLLGVRAGVIGIGVQLTFDNYMPPNFFSGLVMGTADGVLGSLQVHFFNNKIKKLSRGEVILTEEYSAIVAIASSISMIYV